jgi:hypothetical protein
MMYNRFYSLRQKTNFRAGFFLYMLSKLNLEDVALKLW